LHADTPPRYLSCDIKKIKVQRYQMFFLDILRLKVGSLQWLGPMLTHPIFLNFIVPN
jgi:hypothetical protein